MIKEGLKVLSLLGRHVLQSVRVSFIIRIDEGPRSTQGEAREYGHTTDNRE